MKTTFRIYIVLLLSLCSVFADLVPDPAARAVGAVDFQTQSLYGRLVGTTWNYAWRGQATDITFEQGGIIQAAAWPGATWRITGPNSIAIKHPKSGEMSVRFNPEFKKWTCKDWSGGNGVGTLQNPNAKVTQ